MLNAAGTAAAQNAKRDFMGALPARPSWHQQSGAGYCWAMSERKDRLLHRVHIVEGLLRVLDDRLEFMALLSSSADKQAARDALVTDWGMTETQVAHALDMPFSRATKLGRDELAGELAHLRSEIDKAS